MRRLRDAALLVTAILTGVISRRPVRPLGDEKRRALPGDQLLANSRARWTHGVTLHARPREIWPWLVQMGCRRAGWYSYDGLDNGGVASANRIVPELQRVEVGDLFPASPTAEDGFFVKAVDPEHSLVLGGEAGTRYSATWAFVLEPQDETSTRLLTRASGEYKRFTVALMLGLVLRPIDFGMQREQLLNLKQRVEARGG
jgi:hypothetical protein